VADLDYEQPGESVEVALAVGVVDIDAVATVDDRYVAVLVEGDRWRRAEVCS
jgi:hypothetical protein